jgi:hypothetical protein
MPKLERRVDLAGEADLFHHGGDHADTAIGDRPETLRHLVDAAMAPEDRAIGVHGHGIRQPAADPRRLAVENVSPPPPLLPLLSCLLGALVSARTGTRRANLHLETPSSVWVYWLFGRTDSPIPGRFSCGPGTICASPETHTSAVCRLLKPRSTQAERANRS